MIILHLFILPFRPAKLLKAYQSIWTDEGAPLLSIARKQQQKLEKNALENNQTDIIFSVAMRYGNPSISSVLDELKNQKIDKLLVLPLYAQYSGSTTASIFDEVSNVLQGWRNIPEFRIIKDYYDHPLYIKALANSVVKSREEKTTTQHLLMSFHGIPVDYCKKGDPYHEQCQQTASLLAQTLELSDGQWTMSYQSLFGKAEWLKPHTNVTLANMPWQGIENLDIICPGFSNDCLETLEEIRIENKKIFLDAGGKNYQYIPALNDSHEHIQLLLELIKTHTQGW